MLCKGCALLCAVVRSCALLCAAVRSCALLCAVVRCCAQLCAGFSMTGCKSLHVVGKMSVSRCVGPMSYVH